MTEHDPHPLPCHSGEHVEAVNGTLECVSTESRFNAEPSLSVNIDPLPFSLLLNGLLLGAVLWRKAGGR
jgi:hypothetical protein